MIPSIFTGASLSHLIGSKRAKVWVHPPGVSLQGSVSLGQPPRASRRLGRVRGIWRESGDFSAQFTFGLKENGLSGRRENPRETSQLSTVMTYVMVGTLDQLCGALLMSHPEPLPTITLLETLIFASLSSNLPGPNCETDDWKVI
jgi:hypothetical protein